MAEKREPDSSMTLRDAGRRSWTAGNPRARPPGLDEDTLRKVRLVREKQRRGEELTAREVGLLGGAARALRARDERDALDGPP